MFTPSCSVAVTHVEEGGGCGKCRGLGNLGSKRRERGGIGCFYGERVKNKRSLSRMRNKTRRGRPFLRRDLGVGFGIEVQGTRMDDGVEGIDEVYPSSLMDHSV